MNPAKKLQHATVHEHPATYTAVPNAVFELLPQLGYGETKVLLAVVRLTKGYHKDEARINFDVFQELTGLSRQAISDAITALLTYGVITRSQQGRSFAYGLSNSLPTRLVKQVDQSTEQTDNGQAGRPVTVKQVDSYKRKKENFKETPPTPPRGECVKSEDLERIYEAYPKHVGKRKALEKIHAAVGRIAERGEVDDPIEWLLERTRMFAASPAGNKGRFTPHPQTWFYQGRYDDDPAEWGLDPADVPDLSQPIRKSELALALSAYPSLRPADFYGKGQAKNGEPLLMLYPEKRQALGIHA